MEQLYEIYLITNLKNNKHYVGQTKLGRHTKRWEEHKKESRYHNRLLYNALKKDEENSYVNFKFEVIEENIPESLIDQKEINYIKLYNSYYKNGCGYNMTLGGQGVHGYIFTEEDKEKISQGNIKVWTELKQDSEKYNKLCQYRSKIAEGKHFSEEHRKNLSLAAKKRWIVLKQDIEKYDKLRQRWSETTKAWHKNTKQQIETQVKDPKIKQQCVINRESKILKNNYGRTVNQFNLKTGELINTYYGVSNAVHQLNLPISAISRIKSVCDLGYGHAYNFIWRYADLVESISPEALIKENSNPRAKPVIQFDLDGNKIAEFTSAAEASRTFSEDYFVQRTIAKHINEVCLNKKGRKSCKGFIWKYK